MPAPQHVYDAIKKARETGEAWVTWNGFRMRLVPWIWAKVGCFDVPTAEGKAVDGTCFNAIVKSRRAGGIAFAWVDAYKDVGSRIRITEGGPYREFGNGPHRRAGWDEVLAVVTEHHERTPQADQQEGRE